MRYSEPPPKGVLFFGVQPSQKVLIAFWHQLTAAVWRNVLDCFGVNL